MNGLIMIAAVAGVFTTLGHFLVGSRQFLSPMLESSLDPVPKKVMHCVFHYISVYLVSSTIVLLLVGLDVSLGGETELLVKFIAINYGAFALWQIVIAARSGIPKGALKLFQWVFFIIIAMLAWIGA